MKLLYSLADWIDTHVIAECIVEEMKEHDVPLDLDTAKQVWLDVLENLPTWLEALVDRIQEKRERDDEGEV